MIKLYKKNKVYYKAEKDNLVGGRMVCCSNQKSAETFKEFNNIEEAYAYFGIEKPKEEKNGTDLTNN